METVNQVEIKKTDEIANSEKYPPEILRKLIGIFINYSDKKAINAKVDEWLLMDENNYKDYANIEINKIYLFKSDMDQKRLEITKEELIEKIIIVTNDVNSHIWNAWCEYSIKIPNQEIFIKKIKLTTNKLFDEYIEIRVKNYLMIQKQILENPKVVTPFKINKTPKYYRRLRNIKKIQARKRK